MIAAIAAVDGSFGIGYNGQLLESIPDDLKFFKAATLNSTVIMGRKTYESLPKRPLPNRKNIVITSTPKESFDNVIYMNMEEVENYLKNASSEERIFVIGGGSIYRELLPYCNEIFLTQIFKLHDNVDTWFPYIGMLTEWKRDDQNIMVLQYKDIFYQFQHYSRI